MILTAIFQDGAKPKRVNCLVDREIDGEKRQRKVLKRLLRERHIDDNRPFRMEKK